MAPQWHQELLLKNPEEELRLKDAPKELFGASRRAILEMITSVWDNYKEYTYVWNFKRLMLAPWVTYRPQEKTIYQV